MIKKNNYLIIIVIVCVVIIIGVLSWGFLTNWGSQQSSNTNKNNPTFKIEAEKRKKEDERLFETNEEIEAEKRKKEDELLFETNEEIEAQEAKIKAAQEANLKRIQMEKAKKQKAVEVAKIDEKNKETNGRNTKKGGTNRKKKKRRGKS